MVDLTLIVENTEGVSQYRLSDRAKSKKTNVQKRYPDNRGWAARPDNRGWPARPDNRS